MEPSFNVRMAAVFNQPAIAGLLLIIAAIYLSSLAFVLPTREKVDDFSSYYVSALILRRGGDPYTDDQTNLAKQLGLNLGVLVHAADTPAFLLCFAPLTSMSPLHAFWAWFALNSAALMLALALLSKELGSVGVAGRLSILALGLTYFPLVQNFFFSQTQVIVLLLLVLMLRLMEKKKDTAAGSMLGIAALLRGYPLLIIGYAIARRRWRIVAGTILVISIGGIVTVLLAGVHHTLSFVNGALWVTGHERSSRGDNISVGPFVSRSFWAVFGESTSRSANLLRLFLASAAGIAVLAATVRETIRRQSDSDWSLFSLWIVTAVMLSPIAWIHYMVLLMITFVLMVRAGSSGSVSTRAWCAAAISYALAAITFSTLLRHRAESRTFYKVILSDGFFSLMAGYLAAYWFATDAQTPEDPTQLERGTRTAGQTMFKPLM